MGHELGSDQRNRGNCGRNSGCCDTDLSRCSGSSGHEGNTGGVSVQAASALDQEFLLAVGQDPATAQTWATFLATPETLPQDQKLFGAENDEKMNGSILS